MTDKSDGWLQDIPAALRQQAVFELCDWIKIFSGEVGCGWQLSFPRSLNDGRKDRVESN